MFDYYKAWDKFTNDEVLKTEPDFIEAKNPLPEAEKELTQAEMFRRTSGAKPNTKLVIKGGTVKKSTMADTLKLQGNAFFMSLEYEKAIDCYTRCIPHLPESDHNLSCIVYSNRAQCYIKLHKYESAYSDAD